MSPKELKEAIFDYVSVEHKRLDALRRIDLVDFQKLTFKTSDINIETCEQWSLDLASKGTAVRPVLYYFRLIGEVDMSEICETITKMKRMQTNAVRALPKVNAKNMNSPRNILYVGKTDRNFPKRFKEHLGFGHPKTFALNLLHWGTDLGLKIELNFACLNTEHRPHIEGVEFAMHHVLNPVLGRSGR